MTSVTEDVDYRFIKDGEGSSKQMDMMDPESDYIEVQVGERIFCTSRSTLRLAGPGSLLHSLATKHYHNADVCFIDRNPGFFGEILRSLRGDPRWLRHTPACCVDLAWLEPMEAEAQYYSLQGPALTALLGPPRVLRTSLEHARCEYTPPGSWTLSAHVQERVQILLWFPTLHHFELRLHVSSRQSVGVSGKAQIAAWGLELDTDNALGEMQAVLLPCLDRAPWLGGSASPTRWFLDGMPVQILPKRPSGIHQMPLVTVAQNVVTLDELIATLATGETAVEIWPETPQYWAPRYGRGQGLSCGAMGRAAVAGARKRPLTPTEGPEQLLWVVWENAVLEQADWNACAWTSTLDPGVCRAMSRELDARALILCMENGVLRATMGEHCDAIPEATFGLESNGLHSGFVRFWFMMEDKEAWHAEVVLNVHGA